MRFIRTFTVFLAILFSAGVLAADNSAYQKGIVAVTTTSGHKSYYLKAGLKIYQISSCGDFQDGQEVQFLLKDDKVYIPHEGAKDYKCSIISTTESADPNAPPTAGGAYVPTYLKGTILGFSMRRDIHVSGGAGGVGSSARKAKVYELQGPDLIYQVDYCGAFQAGQFQPGQAVEFRVDSGGGRLYIRHDVDKEYSCQLEGTRKPDAPATAAIQPAAASPASAAAPSTARISFSSVPDGADIEIDGSFAGNTPSEIEVPEGERSIVVKKSGFKNWERKMKVAAGSAIHLNAEMEKVATP